MAFDITANGGTGFDITLGGGPTYEDISVAAETDTALALGRAKTRPLGTATTSDTARTLTPAAPAPGVRHVTTLVDTSNTSPYTTASFTPTEGDRLFVAFMPSASLTDPATVTASANGLTFTLVNSDVRASIDTLQLWVSDQAVPASPSAMTITADFGADPATGIVLFVTAVTGITRTGTAAVKQSGANHQALGATPTVTFGAATDTDNIVLAYLFNATNPAGMTPPTSFTENADTGFTTPDRGGEYAYRLSGHTSTTVTWGSTTATACGSLAVEVDTSAAAISAAITTAPETDTALTIGRQKTLALGTATDTETAQTIIPSLSGGGHTVALGTAATTDASQALARRKTRSIGAAADTSSSIALGRRHTRTLGTASDTETAQPLARIKMRALSAATDTSTAVTLGRRRSYPLGPATSTSTATPLAQRKTRALTLATDTSTATTIRPARARALGTTAEAGTAGTLGRAKRRALGLAADAATSGTITPLAGRQIAPATDTETGRPLGHTKARAITPATSTNTAVTITSRHTKAITLAAATHTAVALGRRHGRTFTPALETDTARPLGSRHTTNIGYALEADFAGTITHPLLHPLDLASTRASHGGPDDRTPTAYDPDRAPAAAGLGRIRRAPSSPRLGGVPFDQRIATRPATPVPY